LVFVFECPRLEAVLVRVLELLGVAHDLLDDVSVARVLVRDDLVLDFAPVRRDFLVDC